MENTKKIVIEFEKKLSTEVKKQKKLDIVERKNFRKKELLGKYTIKILYK